MIIHTTTLDTEAKVKAIYGGTTWIQHSGYELRGATSGVVANSAVKTGGNDSVTLTSEQMPSHRHSIPALSGTASSTGSAHEHNMQGDYASAAAEERYTPRQWGSANPRWSATNMIGGGAHSPTVTTDASNTGYTGGNTS